MSMVIESPNVVCPGCGNRRYVQTQNMTENRQVFDCFCPNCEAEFHIRVYMSVPPVTVGADGKYNREGKPGSPMARALELVGGGYRDGFPTVRHDGKTSCALYSREIAARLAYDNGEIDFAGAGETAYQSVYQPG